MSDQATDKINQHSGGGRAKPFADGAGASVEENLQLSRCQISHEQFLEYRERVGKFAKYLPVKSAQIYQVVILDYFEYGKVRFKIGYLNGTDISPFEIRNRLSRLFGQFNINAFELVPLDLFHFEVLYRDAYSKRAIENREGLSETAQIAQTRNWGEKKIADPVADISAQTQAFEELVGKRTDISDMETYQKTLHQINSGIITESDLTTNEFVTFMLQDFIKSGASDIHIESSRTEGGTVRYREQEKLRVRWQNIPLDKYLEYASILVIMANEDSSTIENSNIEAKIPLTIWFNGKKADRNFRLQSLYADPLPEIVMRNQNKPIRDITKLGLYEDDLDKLAQVNSRTRGVFAVTGPTGSGKTFTLESMLAILEEPRDLKISEIGDPCEYEVAWRTQVSIRKTNSRSDKIKLYEEALVSQLRNDPNVLYFTEFRNKLLASIVLDAAITGHLVFTTLHAADVEQTLVRLFQMGFSADMIANGFIGICSQTLIRVLCDKCKELDKGASILAETEIYEANPDGCAYCKLGYGGVTALAEILLFDDQVVGWLLEGLKPREIAVRAQKLGLYEPLKEKARRKLREGLTSEFEIQRKFGLQMESVKESADGKYVEFDQEDDEFSENDQNIIEGDFE